MSIPENKELSDFLLKIECNPIFCNDYWLLQTPRRGVYVHKTQCEHFASVNMSGKNVEYCSKKMRLQKEYDPIGIGNRV